MSKRVLILEDDANRVFIFKKNLIGLCVYVEETALGAINKLNTESWDLLLLDHDLGGEQMVDSGNKNTGSEVARWLSENPTKKPSAIILHSFNPDGRMNMKKLIPEAVVAPGIWTLLITSIVMDESFNDQCKNTAEMQTRSLP